MRFQDYKKTIFISLALLVGLVALFNSPYIFKQFRYSVEGPTPVEAPQAEKGQPNLLTIESLGIQAPIIYVEEKSEKTYQAALVDGVVHHPDTAMVGEAGNAYIFGHSSDFPWTPGNYKTVFAFLPKIEIGSEIVATGQDGTVYRYSVIEKFVVNSDDLSVLSQETEGKKILTLQTSYPVGTALRRYIVRSELKP